MKFAPPLKSDEVALLSHTISCCQQGQNVTKEDLREWARSHPTIVDFNKTFAGCIIKGALFNFPEGIRPVTDFLD